jgi:hypothetical protein
MEIIVAAIITIMAAQLGVLSGIFLRLGGVHEAIETLKNRVSKLERNKGVFHHEQI